MASIAHVLQFQDTFATPRAGPAFAPGCNSGLKMQLDQFQVIPPDQQDPKTTTDETKQHDR